jgi:ribosomal protein S18 acetylase RimI-like enzyme
MTSQSAIRIGTRESLRAQPGLSRLLEIMSREDLGPCSQGGAPEYLVILDLPDGAVACVEAVVDSERIARMGPIVSDVSVCSLLDSQQQHDLWQAGIEWARSQNAAAVQILCDPHSDDLEALASLSLTRTTEILALDFTPALQTPQTEAADPAIRVANVETEFPAIVDLVARTLVDTLDIPEALPLRSPEMMCRAWTEGRGAAAPWTLIAETAEGMCGLLVAGRQGGAVEIFYLGVTPQRRRLGWGSRLLRELLRTTGDSRISTFVDSRNLPAITLYERLGFREELRIPLVFHRF